MIPSEAEFKKMFDCNNTDVLVTVIGQNGVKADLKAELTKTDSENVAIDVKRLSYIGEIADLSKEYPVSLFKTNSSYKLFVSSDNKHPNAVLKRNSHGEMKVVLKEVSKSHTTKMKRMKPQQRIFYVKAKNMETVNPEVTLIKLTPSGNYEFVFEKEFEKLYKETVNHYLGENIECCVNMFKTESGTYIIDFEGDCDNRQNTRVLLTKSNSGSVKFIVNGADFREIESQHELNRRFSKEFEVLYRRLSSSVEYQGRSAPGQKYLDRKPEYGFKLRENIRIRIKDKKHLVAELTVNLKESSPGLYSVIFMNETEALFVANLLRSWQGMLPIERTPKCDLNVYLNRGQQLRNRYGWLKLSSDGKIHVVVENKPSKGVVTDTYSVGLVLREKGVATTCHGQQDCTCDKSQCMCNELVSEWVGWNFGQSENSIIKEVSWSKTNLED